MQNFNTWPVVNDEAAQHGIVHRSYGGMALGNVNGFPSEGGAVCCPSIVLNIDFPVIGWNINFKYHLVI